MNLRAFNIVLLLAFSFGVVLPGHPVWLDFAQALGAEMAEKLEVFVKDDPKAAAAVIVALGSVIIFKDVIVSGAQKTIKTIKENPVVSLGTSLIIAGVAYGCWEHYYNHESDFVEQILKSVQSGAKSFWDKAKYSYENTLESFAGMTDESGKKVRDTAAKTKELIQNKIQ